LFLCLSPKLQLTIRNPVAHVLVATTRPSLVICSAQQRWIRADDFSACSSGRDPGAELAGRADEIARTGRNLARAFGGLLWADCRRDRRRSSLAYGGRAAFLVTPCRISDFRTSLLGRLVGRIGIHQPRHLSRLSPSRTSVHQCVSMAARTLHERNPLIRRAVGVLKPSWVPRQVGASGAPAAGPPSSALSLPPTDRNKMARLRYFAA